jgi:polyadenylate-binding protein
MWSQRDPSLRRSGVGNVFVRNLAPSVDNKGLYDTFSVFGNILSCKVATDETGASKGYGYVHFETAEAAQDAIQKFNGTLIEDVEVHVGPFVKRQDRPGMADWTNLYVKQFSVTWDEARLRDAFLPCGVVTNVIIMKDPEGKSKGFGFVNMADHESAVKAVQELNGKTIEDGEDSSFELYVGEAQKKARRQEDIKKRIDAMNSDRAAKYQGMNLYVKNIADTVTDDVFREGFAPFGTITSARIMRDTAEPKASKGFGFVCFSSPEEATRAVTEMNGKLMANKPLVVTLHQRRELRRAHLAATYAPQGGNRMYPGGGPQGGGPAQGGMPMGPGGPFMGMGGMYMQPGQQGGFPGQQPGMPRNMMPYPYPQQPGGGPMGGRVGMMPPQGGAVRSPNMGAPFGGAARSAPQGQSAYYAQQGGMPMGAAGGSYMGPGGGSMNSPAGMQNMQFKNRPPMQHQGGAMPMGGAYLGGGMPPQQGGGAMGMQQRRGGAPMAAGGMNGGQLSPPGGSRGGMPAQQQPNRSGYPANGQMQQQQQQMRNGGVKFNNQARNQGGMPQQQQSGGMPQQQPNRDMMLQQGNDQKGISFSDVALASADPLMQKNMIGEHLYPLIFVHQPELAGKITGMLLEMDNGELLNLIESPDALMSKIGEALSVLRNHQELQRRHEEEQQQ